MRPLVIGATGFIGLNIVRILRSEGYEVLATKRPSSNTLFLRKFKPELIEADCMDFASLVSVMKRADVVFMAAGHYPRYSVNCEEQVDYALEMIRNVLKAAKEAQVKKFIYTSSVTTVDGKVVNEEPTPPPGPSVYYAVKYAMEKEVLKALDEGLAGTVLCVAGCLGPFDIKMGTGSLIVNTLNRRFSYYIDGKINLIDVEDVARAHVECMKKTDLRKRYLLAHHDTTIKEFLRFVSTKYGVPMPRRIPLWAGAPYVRVMEHYNHRKKKRALIPLEFVDMLKYGQVYGSGSCREEIFDYNTPLETTIDKSYDWFKKYKYIRTAQ